MHSQNCLLTVRTSEEATFDGLHILESQKTVYQEKALTATL